MQPIVRVKRDSRRGRLLSGTRTDRVQATKTRAGFPLVPLIFKVLAIPRRRTVRSRETRAASFPISLHWRRIRIYSKISRRALRRGKCLEMQLHSLWQTIFLIIRLNAELDMVLFRFGHCYMIRYTFLQDIKLFHQFALYCVNLELNWISSIVPKWSYVLNELQLTFIHF